MNVDFHEQNGVMIGTDDRGRQWRVVQAVTGWRLEFRDAGDPAPTYAGTHRDLERAMHEASR